MSMNASFSIDLGRGHIEVRVNQYNNKTEYEMTVRGVNYDDDGDNVIIKSIDDDEFRHFVRRLQNILNVVDTQ